MGQYRLPVDQLHEYRQSAHGVALFEGGNFAAPTCVGCHGAHSALPPGTLEVANVCSRCHQLVGQATALGPHGAAARAGKFPGCLGCHSNHRTERIPPDSTAGLCQKCHADDSRIREVGLDIQRLMTQASSDLRSAERAVERLRVDGRRTGDHRFRYQSALSYYLQIAQVQHSLDLERLEDLGRRVRSTSVQLGAAAEVSAERRWEQKLILLPVWFLALSAVALALLILRAVRVRKGVEES
jgi:predicted CXXCH cytochrome family protein